MRKENTNAESNQIFRDRFRELYTMSQCQSITQFAQKLKMNRQSVDRYYNGDRLPDLTSIIQICRIMSVSADWLLGLSDVKSQSADTINAVNVLGISEEAVKTVQEFDDMGKQSLSWLIEFGSKAEIGFFEAWNEYLNSLAESNYSTIRNNEVKRDETGIDGITEDGRIVLDPRATTEYRSIIVERRFSRLCEDSFRRFNFFDLKTNGRKET